MVDRIFSEVEYLAPRGWAQTDSSEPFRNGLLVILLHSQESITPPCILANELPEQNFFTS